MCALAGLCLAAESALNVAFPKIRRSRDWCATGGIQHRSQGREEGEAKAAACCLPKHGFNRCAGGI